jgi:hypothetical protein
MAHLSRENPRTIDIAGAMPNGWLDKEISALFSAGYSDDGEGS